MRPAPGGEKAGFMKGKGLWRACPALQDHATAATTDSLDDSPLLINADRQAAKPELKSGQLGFLSEAGNVL